jgi:hypothetical protein
VLDRIFFSSIIYIWYEGGQLRPSLVRIGAVEATRPYQSSPSDADSARRCPDAKIAVGG